MFSVGAFPRREQFATRGLSVDDGPRQGAAGWRQPRRRSSLLVALRERIGLDQIGGLVDQLVLAIGLGAADAGLRPEVMVFVDADVAFRRALELDARRSRRDLVDVEAARLLDRQLSTATDRDRQPG